MLNQLRLNAVAKATRRFRNTKFQDQTLTEILAIENQSDPVLFMPRPTPSLLVFHPRHSSKPATAVAAVPYPVQWLRTGKNLDFCLLAICSCVLTVLCHQTVLPSSAVSSSTLSSTVLPSQIDSTVKSALFSSTQQRKRQAQRDVLRSDS